MQVTKTPGKLYLAGEYAVMTPGQAALVAAVNRYVVIRLEEGSSQVLSNLDGYKPHAWIRSDHHIRLEAGASFDLLAVSMTVAESYLREHGIRPIGRYSLNIESQLEDKESGYKYGLGSSGAVTVGVIQTILKAHNCSVLPLTIYQLAVMAQVWHNEAGSFGDIAAASFAHLIYYQSPDRSWLEKQVLAYHAGHISIKEILQMVWPSLVIEPIALPKASDMLVGWTQSPVKTAHLLRQTSTSPETSDFFEDNHRILTALYQACQSDDSHAFHQGIRDNRKLLQAFAARCGIVLETDRLKQLIAIAEEEGAASKTSGAGGGDCGICFVTNPFQKSAIYKRWQEAGIVPLEISLVEKGE